MTERRPGVLPLVDVPLVGGPVVVRGALTVEADPQGLLPRRLPAWARAQMPDDVVRLSELQPAGVRLAFRTSARRLELDVRAARVTGAGRPVPPGGCYDVVADGVVVAQPVVAAHGVAEVDFVARTVTWRPAPVATVAVELPGSPAPDGVADVQIWLPYGEITHLVGLRADRPVLAPSVGGRGAGTPPRWVHHGSSISHGAAAASPTGTWPVAAARALGLDLLNLSLAGQAVLDPFTARTIAAQPADLVSLKLGVNVVNTDCFRKRAFGPAVHGFLDAIREHQPHVPLVLVSPLLCPMLEDTPGPTSTDPASPPDAPRFRASGDPADVVSGRLTLRVIREVLAEVAAVRGDPALAYVDGRALYGEEDWARMPHPDALHPSPAAHAAIAARFAVLVAPLVAPLVPPPTVAPR